MENTAKSFAVQLGAVISLYTSIIAFVALMFGIINLSIPDVVENSWQIESSMDSIRFAVATLLIFFPAYVALTRVVNKQRRAGKGDYLPLTKWVLYLSLLLAALVLLGTFATTIYTFLNGELTNRFLLKALTLTAVLGAAFYYYIKDARNYWNKKEKYSIYFGVGVGVVVLGAIVYGFTLVDSPQEVREQKIDQTQVMDLQDMQWRIQDYLAVNNTVPVELADVYVNNSVPEAPAGRPDYEYQVTTEGFELCATFATDSRTEHEFFGRTVPTREEAFPVILNPDNWEYTAGETCFSRVVSPLE